MEQQFSATITGNFIEPQDLEDGVSLSDSHSFHLKNGSLHFDDFTNSWGFIDSNSVDCIITDPPYWTLDKWRNMGTTTRLGGALKKDDQDSSRWFETINEDGLVELIDECYRVLKKGGHCWMMSDGQTLPYLLNYATRGEGHKFDYVKPFPVLKKAGTGGYRQGMGYHGRCVHEYIVFMAEKKHRPFSDRNWPDVFEYNWTGDAETRPFTSDKKPYPTAKPTAFFERLIELSTSPGEIVFDPFFGSGTVPVSALRHGRRFIGIDKNPESLRTTNRRIEDFYKKQKDD